MQPTFSEIKRAAKCSLKQRWAQAIAVSLVLVTTGMLNGFTQHMLMTIFKVKEVWTPFTPTELPLYSHIASVGITVFSAVFSLAVMFPLFFGVMKWFWLITGGSDPGLIEIFYYFSSSKLFFKTLGLSLGIYIRLVIGVIVCFLPYIVGGILTTPYLYDAIGIPMPVIMEGFSPLVSFLEIFGFVAFFMFVAVYAMCYAVMFSEPELTAHKTIRATVKMSKGFRFGLVCFVFSFFGWILASFLILPIIFVLPYMLASLAAYGREVYRANTAKNQNTDN